MKKSIEQKILNRINKTDTCWLWLGKPDAKGYGRLWLINNAAYVHRLAYELWVGPIPKDKPFVCHHCDVTLCVKPTHLFVGTAKDNNQDCAKKGRNYQSKKTHCPRGHEYNKENTYVSKTNTRKCKICDRVRKKL